MSAERKALEALVEAITFFACGCGGDPDDPDDYGAMVPQDPDALPPGEEPEDVYSEAYEEWLEGEPGCEDCRPIRHALFEAQKVLHPERTTE